MIRRSRLDRLRRESRGARARFGETRDGVWHRLVVGSFAHDTAFVACRQPRVGIRRIASDMVDSEITCPTCRAEERTSHAG